MEYNAHALGNYKGYTMTNSKEALLNSYKSGFRYFEVDIQRTSDGRFVAYHLWNKNDADYLMIPFDENNPVPDYNTFLSYRYMKNVFPEGLTPLSLDDIFSFMKEHKDTVFMFDFLAGYEDKDNAELMQSFGAEFKDEDIIKRSIIETYSLNNLASLYNSGFRNIIPWIDAPELSEEGFREIDEILSVLKKYDIKNVSINPYRIRNNNEDIPALKKAGVRIYMPGWNGEKSLAKLVSRQGGVGVATTDLMRCGLMGKLTNVRYRLLSHIFSGAKAQKYREKYIKTKCIW